jgi:hypothetical protein
MARASVVVVGLLSTSGEQFALPSTSSPVVESSGGGRQSYSVTFLHSCGQRPSSRRAAPAVGMGIILMPQQLAPLPQQVATTSPADQQSARSPAPSTATRCQHPASCCPISRRPAGGPARALPAPSQPSALRAHRRPLPAPAGSEQGATGGFARRASGTLPQITRPKTGKFPLLRPSSAR